MRFQTLPQPLVAGVALLSLLLLGGNAGATDVTITQKAPLESVSTSGAVIGVSESTVGARMTLVSMTGPELTLQNGAGAHYEIAASATDYVPPAVLPAPDPQPTVPAPSSTAKAKAAVLPPPPVNAASTAFSIQPPAQSPYAGKPAAAADAPSQFGPTPDALLNGFPVEDRSDDNLMAVWPQGGIANRPLLIAAHGHGGSGPNEIRGWVGLARAHRFTIVCPTFKSSVNSSFLDDDESYFRACLRWMENNLQYDKVNVYMTGFSGGGYSVWYLATKRPDVIHGLFMQSCNFIGVAYDLDLGPWYNRPIKVIWGSQDLPDIAPSGQLGLQVLKDGGCKNVTTEVVGGAGHQEHPDMVVKWMEDSVAAAAIQP